MEAGVGEWEGEFDPFDDPEESRVLFAALDSFSQYRRAAHRNVTHRRRQSFYALPSSHWQKLAQPPFSLLDVFNKIDDAIDVNADLADLILASGLEGFGLPKNPLPEHPRNWKGKATPGDLSKANSTIRQFYRDWSAEGSSERAISYGPVISDLQQEFGIQPKPGTKVLIPGAGLGRLVFDVAMEGFFAEGNEISYHQLMASSWILNLTQKKEERALYPHALHFSNIKSRRQQLQKVMIPDVHPGSAVQGYDTSLGEASDDGKQRKMTGTMSMTAADFLILYSDSQHEAAFDAVSTVFFIDTAPNVIRYIETIHYCLKPGGIWINVGPLLWHFEDSSIEGRAKGGDATEAAHAPGDDDLERNFQGIGEPGVVELAEEELLLLIESMGFKLEKYDASLGVCGYIQDPDSMLQNLYKPSHWVMRKV
ncbi:hypothetical protein FQN57_001815 [Myotisia sp. PD_48]|nr:hypothetical protein FQN57_001815 [Myotisia sp. PD_48]